MTELNKITGVVAGSYGEAIILTIVDDNSVPVDVSSYTTSKKVVIRDPFTLNTKTYDATFVSDGSDGQIQFTPSSGDIDRPGDWEGQVELCTASARAITVLFDLTVLKRLGST